MSCEVQIVWVIPERLRREWAGLSSSKP